MDTHQLKLRMLMGMRDDLHQHRMCRATRARLVSTHAFFAYEVKALTDQLQFFRDNARNRRLYFRRQFLKFGQGALS